jgi:hypothetical protein
MKIEEAYIRFVDIVNRNMTNNNVNVDKIRFIFLFNSASIKYLSWILEKRNEDDIRQVAPFLVLDSELKVHEKQAQFDKYKLPKDYFDLANVSVFASKDSCINQKLFTFEVKSENTEELLADENNKPSFDYRETFYLTASDKLIVYKDSFSIDSVILAYYRYPKKVDIEGYFKEDGKASVSIDPEFSDRAIEKILLIMAKDFTATNGDANGFQINSARLASEY